MYPERAREIDFVGLIQEGYLLDSTVLSKADACAQSVGLLLLDVACCDKVGSPIALAMDIVVASIQAVARLRGNLDIVVVQFSGIRACLVVKVTAVPSDFQALDEGYGSGYEGMNNYHCFPVGMNHMIFFLAQVGMVSVSKFLFDAVGVIQVTHPEKKTEVEKVQILRSD